MYPAFCRASFNYDVTLTYFSKGRFIADTSDDKEYTAKSKILEGLFFSDGETQLIENAFSYLASRKMFADVENFSIEVADYFHEQGNLMLSNEQDEKLKKGRLLMKISRILLAAVILSSVFSITYLQSDHSTEVKVAADRVGA